MVVLFSHVFQSINASVSNSSVLATVLCVVGLEQLFCGDSRRIEHELFHLRHLCTAALGLCFLKKLKL